MNNPFFNFYLVYLLLVQAAAPPVGPWSDLIKQLGFGVALTAFLGWFLAYKVWPFYCKQVEENAAQRERIMKQFDERMAELGQVNRGILDGMNALTIEVRSKGQK